MGCSEGRRRQYENKTLRVINSTKRSDGGCNPCDAPGMQLAVVHTSLCRLRSSHGVHGGQLLPRKRQLSHGCAAHMELKGQVLDVAPSLPELRQG